MPIKRLTKTAASDTTAAAPAPAKGKKVTVVAPPVTEAKATKAAKAAAPKTPKATRNISADAFLGRHMRIAEFQDFTLSINAKERRTDEELCAIWQKQFPKAVTFTVHHVKGVRRDYNAGRHSKQFPGKKTGDAISVGYVKQGDKRVVATTPEAVTKTDGKPEAKPKASKAAAA